MSPGQLAADSIGAVPTELMLVIVALLSLAAIKLLFVWIVKDVLEGSGERPGNRTFDHHYSAGVVSDYHPDARAINGSIDRHMRKRS